MSDQTENKPKPASREKTDVQEAPAVTPSSSHEDDGNAAFPVDHFESLPCSECGFKGITIECRHCFVSISTERLGRPTTEPDPECAKGCYLRDSCMWCLIGNACNVDACDTWCSGCRKPNAMPCRCCEPKLKQWGVLRYGEPFHYCEACGGCRCLHYKGPQTNAPDQQATDSVTVNQVI